MQALTTNKDYLTFLENKKQIYMAVWTQTGTTTLLNCVDMVLCCLIV